MDTLRAARYPFLKDASQFIEANDIDIAELMTSPDWSDARRRGMERIIGSLKNHEIPDVPLAGAEYRRLEECLSYPYARMIVSCIDDRMLTKRYALAEAERLNRLLHDDRDAIPMVAEELEVNAHTNRDGTVSMHFADYLRYSYVMSAIEWKLINTDIRDGYVLLQADKFDRLLQNAYRLRIERELPLAVPNELKKYLSKNIEHVKAALMELKAALSPTNGEGVKDEFLPPCIKAIISMARSGQNLPHSARFALVSFLHTMGMTYDQIISIFSESPDFDEGKSRYQIQHITGDLNGTEGYTPPGCGAMKTDGICFNPDNLCEKVKHPLSYYRIKSGRGFGPKERT